MARKGAMNNEHAKNCETSRPKPRDDSPSVVRFLRVMYAQDYSKVLFLPSLFAESVKHLAGQETELEDLDGTRWPVEYSYVDGSLAFQKGWNKFYFDHGLKIGHFVVFNYVYESHFVVQIYDETAMEITDFNSVGPQSKKMARKGTTHNEHAKNCETSRPKPRDDSPSPVRFLRVMYDKDYSKVLYLPSLFAENVKHLAGQETELEDLDENRWPVQYSYVDGSLAFQKGWSKFYIDRGLKIGHFVVFNYKKESYFVVQIYDETAMEITDFNSVGPQSNKRLKRNPETVCIDDQAPQSADANLREKSSSAETVASHLEFRDFQTQTNVKDRLISMGIDNPRQKVKVGLMPTSLDDPILLIDTRNNGCYDQGRNKSAERDYAVKSKFLKSSVSRPLPKTPLGRNKSAETDYAVKSKFPESSVSRSLPKSSLGPQPAVMELRTEGNIFPGARYGKISIIATRDGDRFLPVVEAEPDVPYDTVSLSAISPFSVKVESQLYLELPVRIPLAARRRERNGLSEGQVVFLRGPNGRLIPVLYPDLFVVKKLTGNWNLFCEKNGLKPGDECRFVVEDGFRCLYRVEITRSNG